MIKNGWKKEARSCQKSEVRVFKKDNSFLRKSGWPLPRLGKHEPSVPSNASVAFVPDGCNQFVSIHNSIKKILLNFIPVHFPQCINHQSVWTSGIFVWIPKALFEL